jgi:hypothetical protein
VGKIYLAAVMMSLLLVRGSVNTAYADTCSELVAFGLERLKSVENEETRAQIMVLLNQANGLCSGDNKEEGIRVAQIAIERTEQR